MQLAERYVENVEQGNWPEARFEWRFAFGQDSDEQNPFDVADAMIENLESLVNRRDFTEADATVNSLLDGDRLPGGYRREDVEAYKDALGPVRELLRELEECESRREYAGGLKVVERLERLKWQVRGLDERRACLEVLEQLGRIRCAVSSKSWSNALAEGRSVNVHVVGDHDECRAQWLEIMLEFLRRSIESNELTIAKDVVAYIEESGVKREEEQQLEFTALKKACFANLAEEGRRRIGGFLRVGEWDAALVGTRELLDGCKGLHAEFWPELGHLPDAIAQYQNRVSEANDCRNRCQFEEALRLVREIPASMRSCHVVICEELTKELAHLVERKEDKERGLVRMRNDYAAAVTNKRYVKAYRLALRYEVGIRRLTESRQQLFALGDLTPRIGEAEALRKQARWRAVRAILTGEVLFQWIVKRIAR